MTLHRCVRLVAFAALIAWTSGGTASASDDYPNKTIKLIVPSAAGGPTDVPARLASEILKNKFGQPVVIENRPGAGGALGARSVATAAPDGYTLMMGNTSVFAVIPAVSASAGYDPIKDFISVVRMTEAFQMLVVHPSSPWTSVKAFVDDSKANPAKINYAHTGAGGLPHLAGELFAVSTGAKMSGVPYRSGGEATTAVLSQAVHATFESIAILRGLVNEGKLRALGLQNAARSPRLPGVPTMAEAGAPGAEANTFYGIAAPAGTPASVVAKLNAAINEALATPDMQKLITGLGSEAKPNSPTEFSAYVAAQLKKWIDVGKAANVKVN